MPTQAAVLKAVRLTHLYLGVFIAPAIVFFAITGALQTFSLHETTRGSDYKPPSWIVTLAQLHKKQTTVLPVRRPQQPAAGQSAPPVSRPQARSSAAPPGLSTAPGPEPASSARRPNLLPMKVFFLIVAIGLCLSTSSGIYMSWKYHRNKIAVAATLAAGILVPLVLVLLQR